MNAWMLLAEAAAGAAEVAAAPSQADKLIRLLTVFMLAMWVGFEVITKVPPILHTPLTSGSNAVSGITIVGSMVATGAMVTALTTSLGFVAVVFAAINVVGGFLVTHRMLLMYRRR